MWIEGKSDRCRGLGIVVSTAMSGPRRRHRVADNYGETTITVEIVYNETGYNEQPDITSKVGAEVRSRI